MIPASIQPLLRVFLAGADPIYLFFESGTPRAAFVVMALLSPVVWWCAAKLESSTGDWRSFWIAFVIVFILQWGFQSLTERGAYAIIRNNEANSFYSLTERVPLSDYLAHFFALRDKLPLHATSNMPGKALFYYGLRLLGDLPEFFACVVLLISNLGGLFLYWITLHLSPNKKAALLAALFYWLHPAKLYFFPLLNTVTPSLLLLNLWLLLRCLSAPHWSRITLLGLSLYALFLFEPLPLVCGLIFLFFIGDTWFRGRLLPKQLWRISVGVIGVFLLSNFIFGALTGFRSLEVFWELLRVNTSYYQTYQSSWWFLRNLFDLGVGFGYASCLALGLLFFNPSLNKRVLAYGIVWLATLLILNSMGVTKAEIQRLWIFIISLSYPFLALALVEIRRRGLIQSILMANYFQTILAMHYIGFIWWP